MIHESREPPQSPDLNLGVKMSVKAANISKNKKNLERLKNSTLDSVILQAKTRLLHM